MMGWWHGYPGGGSDVAGLLVIVLLGVLLWSLWRGKFPAVPWGRSSRRRTAIDVAELRYARGEISRDEFLELANDLYMTDSYHTVKRKRSEQ